MPFHRSATEPLRCPDCHAEIWGTDSVTCSIGHKPIKLDWWPVCECGHDAHYDMTGFCLRCDCEEYREGTRLRQVTRRVL